MQIGVKPEKTNIEIIEIGNKYEINLNNEVWIYLSKKQIRELNCRINNVLRDIDKEIEMIREKGGYIESIG